jgi:prepilin-type N-terminal cleavage/methylation domain-containing protein
MIRTYLEIVISGRIRHPREGGGPLNALKKMDSRLRGNDKSERLHSFRGFTLLEVLVATAILGIAVAVVLQLFSANLRALALSEDYVSATKRAEAKMREILDAAPLAETSFSETTGDGYRIDVSVTNALEERTETLPVKLLEISLTVHWTKGIKERSLSLKTMKVVKKEIT